MRWFYKTTEPIPIVNPEEHYIGDYEGLQWYTVSVQAGLYSKTGQVFINYCYCPIYHPSFWWMHYHEFLHRVFWLLKFKFGDIYIDFIDLIIYYKKLIKKIRMEDYAQRHS